MSQQSLSVFIEIPQGKILSAVFCRLYRLYGNEKKISSLRSAMPKMFLFSEFAKVEKYPREHSLRTYAKYSEKTNISYLPIRRRRCGY